MKHAFRTMSHGQNTVKLKPNNKIQLDSPNTCEN